METLQHAVLNYYTRNSAHRGNTSASSSSTLNKWIQLATFTFSSEKPSVANTGSNTALVADEWNEALYATCNLTPTPSSRSLHANRIVLLNPDFVELMQQHGISVSPCNATSNGAEQVLAGSVSIAGTGPRRPCATLLYCNLLSFRCCSAIFSAISNSGLGCLGCDVRSRDNIAVVFDWAAPRFYFHPAGPSGAGATTCQPRAPESSPIAFPFCRKPRKHP